MGNAPTPAQCSIWWLPNVVAELGPAEKDPELERWTWQDGDVGVFVDKLTHAWQAVAWTPMRSVTLRGRECPSDADMVTLVRLAELTRHRRAGDPA